jgi:8'-apo-carotenoid 13,14-cleaving dioxygenase
MTQTMHAPTGEAIIAPVENPLLNGLHRPMSEEFTLTELAVQGVIPPTLKGNYLKIGPNPIHPNLSNHHWFIGDGMVHGLAIEGGKAHWYRNRWIRSETAAAHLGVAVAPGERRGDGNVNTSIIQIAGRTLALSEAGNTPVELSDNLEEQTQWMFGGSLEGAFSAHPHYDPRTGENHAICYAGSDPTALHHVVVDAAGTVIREEPIDLPHGPMIHNCAVTDRYVLVLDSPVAFNVALAEAGDPVPWRWRPEQPTRVGLMPRTGRQEDIIWCTVAPGFVYHPVNAFDRADGKVEMDVCAYTAMFTDESMWPGGLNRGLERWIIDPETRTVSIEILDSSPQEFPRIDERLVGQAYRYAYTVAMPDLPTPAVIDGHALYRHDLETGKRQAHAFGKGRVPGEFVFVPKHEGSDEADGWLIGFVIDADHEQTDLVIIDATKFEEQAVAMVRLPHRIPPGFHGNWIASDATPPSSTASAM